MNRAFFKVDGVVKILIYCVGAFSLTIGMPYICLRAGGNAIP